MSDCQVVRGITPQIEMSELLRASRRPLTHPAFVAAAEAALERARGLAQPAGVYRWLPVAGVESGRLLLGNGGALAVGENVHMLAEARQALVFVDTIGPALEEEVRRLFAAGQALEGYLLDCAGVVALASARHHMQGVAEAEAARRGWGVSCFTAPGSLVGWPVSGQRELTALVDLTAIGLRLTEGCMLQPAKSAAGLVAIGPGFAERTVGSACHLCQLSADCWRRRA